jgi:hypothetical protein
LPRRFEDRKERQGCESWQTGKEEASATRLSFEPKILRLKTPHCSNTRRQTNPSRWRPAVRQIPLHDNCFSQPNDFGSKASATCTLSWSSHLSTTHDWKMQGYPASRIAWNILNPTIVHSVFQLRLILRQIAKSLAHSHHMGASALIPEPMSFRARSQSLIFDCILCFWCGNVHESKAESCVPFVVCV